VNRSPGPQFPANREIYREFRQFGRIIPGGGGNPYIFLNVGDFQPAEPDFSAQLNRELSARYQGITIPVSGICILLTANPVDVLHCSC
jgi:hypothetical protein